jgi:hypothetical protein
MRISRCIFCDHVHSPLRACPAGAARQHTVDFPKWVATSACNLRSQTMIVSDRHGCTRTIVAELTEHGRRLLAYRPSELAPAERPAPVHRATHRGRRLAA